MKSAFTMIELIFVIVIIGVLASISIPKFSATRDDAKTSVVLTNLSDCITYAAGSYTATGRTLLNSGTCKKAKKCFDIELGNNSDTNGTIIVKSGNGVNSAPDKDETYCQAAYQMAEHNDLASPSGKVHDFGATHVVYDN